MTSASKAGVWVSSWSRVFGQGGGREERVSREKRGEEAWLSGAWLEYSTDVMGTPLNTHMVLADSLGAEVIRTSIRRWASSCIKPWPMSEVAYLF